MDLPRSFVVRESSHRILNPFTAEKLVVLGRILHLRAGMSVLDLASGKGELLAASLTDISETLLKEASARASSAASPSEALDALIEWHVDFALDHPALIVVQDREWANLGESARRDVRALQLGYIDVWVDTVQALRPDLDHATTRAAVQATFGLLNSTPHSARIRPPVMRALLVEMARRALAG